VAALRLAETLAFGTISTKDLELRLSY